MDERIEELLKRDFSGSLYSVRTPKGVEPSGFDITIPIDKGFVNLICLFGIGLVIYLDENRKEIKRENLTEEDCEQILKIISDAKE